MLHEGLHLHKRFSTFAAMDQDGSVRLEGRLYHDDRVRLREYFSKVARKEVVTAEATRKWYQLYELLEEQGVTFELASARKVWLFAEARLKNEKIDAKTLAQPELTGFCRGP